MSSVDKTKDAVEKFKNSGNEQVRNVKDKTSEYAGSNNEGKKEDEDKEK